MILVPRRENIRALREELFAPPEAPPVTIENLIDRVLEEEATIGVYNGTQTFGLAGETQDYLTAKGVNVTVIGNADSSQYPTTRIITYDDESHPYTLQYLVNLLSMPPLNISAGDAEEPLEDVDLLIILGADWSIPDSTE
ncbi:MAG: LytR C-terminal domain-containing protein [Chloroflexota bacterium]